MRQYSHLVTYIISIRIDSPERLANVQVVIHFLVKYFNAQIFILETDTEPKFEIEDQYKPNCTYWFVEDNDPIFHRTRYLNLMYQRAETPILAIWDADIILPIEQIGECVEKISHEEVAMCIAHSGQAYFMPQHISSQYRESMDMNVLTDNMAPTYISYGCHTVGGIFLVDRKKYLAAGGENEVFYGWGVEDNERVMRMEILHDHVYRANGPIFHLYHPVLTNSRFTSAETEFINRREFLKISRMSKSELKNYITPLKSIVADKK